MCPLPLIMKKPEEGIRRGKGEEDVLFERVRGNLTSYLCTLCTHLCMYACEYACMYTRNEVLDTN